MCQLYPKCGHIMNSMANLSMVSSTFEKQAIRSSLLCLNGIKGWVYSKLYIMFDIWNLVQNNRNKLEDSSGTYF